ncbi:AraC family transcriptional regulator [Clostridium sp. Marseille-P299]|uniref:AraC family transcriptional regulator n=1 Tax=Clostridium sp. Marseille-P299 TaxID=1805477 RepID=UPI000836F248|nr:AraC family transcriptional regulator [Clostridium sp. Marseille-P299]
MREVIFEEFLDSLKIERVILNNEQSMPSNYFPDEYEIYYLLNGEGNLFIEKETYNIKKGSLVLINKGQVHKISFSKGTLYERIWIQSKEQEFQLLFAIGEKESQNLDHYFTKFHGVFELNEKEQKHVESILYEIAEEIRKKDSGYQWMAYVKLIEFFIFIIRRKSSIDLKNDKTLSPRHEKVEEIAEFITRNFNTEQSLEQLSEQFGVNKNYLSRVFKETTGFTVAEYVNLQRMKKSRELLLDKSISIKEVSALLGYESITYFGRIFKRYMGITPLKYRNKMLLQKQ